MSPTRAYLGWGSLLYLLRNLICDTRRAGKDRREMPKSSHTVLELGIYVKAEVQGMLFLGAEAQTFRLPLPHRKHITPPE